MLYKKVIFPVLKEYSWWHSDAEYAHTLALAGIEAMQCIPGLMGLLEFVTKTVSGAKPREVFGIRFPTPIGLAAGLDKNGECLPFWQAIGFGFAEIGTVLPNAQTGNPRPRLFRLDKEEQLINRMGFNSSGVATVRENLGLTKRHVHIPVGGSLGAMKETVADKPENAKLDYISAARELVGLVDFFVANVSSPNTPGLRGLQGKAYIEDLLLSVSNATAIYARSCNLPTPPLLAKVAPDLTIPEFDDVIEAALAAGTAGLVIGNTTTSRPWGTTQPLFYAEAGGLSGGDWLFERALELCRYARRVAPKLALILVGGIDSRQKAIKALQVADLIEVLTAFVYQGPKLIRTIRRVRVPEPAFPYARRAAA